MIRPCVAKSFFLNKCLQKCSKFTRNLNITMRPFMEMVKIRVQHSGQLRKTELKNLLSDKWSWLNFGNIWNHRVSNQIFIEDMGIQSKLLSQEKTQHDKKILVCERRDKKDKAGWRMRPALELGWEWIFNSSSPLSESAGRWDRPFLLINLLASN